MAAIALLPAGAPAAAKRVTYASFVAEGSNGYRLWFFGRGSGNAQRASLSVQKGRSWSETTVSGGELVDAKFGPGSSAAYYRLKRGKRISARRIEVPMGSLGEISARFRQKSAERVRGRCIAGTLRRGELVGELRFEGENGYTTVDPDRVKARIATVRRTCVRGRHRTAVGAALRRVGSWQRPLLIACGPNPGELLIASRSRYEADFMAMKFERTPDAAITRIASAMRPADDFSLRRNLKSATLHPAPPVFRGEARYGGQATTGDLRARMPGLGAVQMVPGDAVLTRDRDPQPPDCAGIPGTSRVSELRSRALISK